MVNRGPILGPIGENHVVYPMVESRSEPARTDNGLRWKADRMPMSLLSLGFSR